MHCNLVNEAECQVLRTFKIEIQKGVPNTLGFLQNWLPAEIRSLHFNLKKFHKSLTKVLLNQAECIVI